MDDRHRPMDPQRLHNRGASEEVQCDERLDDFSEERRRWPCEDNGRLEKIGMSTRDEIPLIDLATRLALRPKEAAAALGISERKLRDILPELPTVRAGGVVLVPVDALRDWLRESAHAESGSVDAMVEEVLADLR